MSVENPMYFRVMMRPTQKRYISKIYVKYMTLGGCALTPGIPSQFAFLLHVVLVSFTHF